MIKCEKCGRSLKELEFYTYKDGTKTELCKKCLTMHIQNDKPETFLWLLEKMDVPYVPGEWNSLYNKAYAKNPDKINGMSVFGKYLSKMRLSQYKDKGWAHSKQLQEEAELRDAQKAVEQKQIEEELRNKYENGEINEAEYRTLTSTATQQQQDLAAKAAIQQQAAQNYYDEDKYISEDELPDLGAELTQEDKIMLAMKWSREYTPAEWVQLEKNYTDFEAEFGVEDPDTNNALILLCKTNLKMNQAIDSSDFESYNKLSKVYDSLRKSAKFTAAQKKEEADDTINCIGELVAYCEEYGGAIPRHDLSIEYDVFDKVINDMKKYTRDLIYGDPALARLIEDYIARSIALAQKKKDKEEALAAGKEIVELNDQDYIDHKNRIQDEREYDDEMEEEE